MLFPDRAEAGRRLAELLQDYKEHADVIVLGLPRGGVPIAFEVAQALRAPLDVLLVRKLGVPGHEELAMGAIASGDVRFINEDLVKTLKISPDAIEQEAAAELKELERREHLYRADRPPLDLRDRTVILIDDGLATGATMRVSANAVRQQQPKQIIAAVPVAAPEICDPTRLEVDEVRCVETPQPFYAVGLWYKNFPQTSDAEVRDLLRRAQEQQLTGTAW